MINYSSSELNVFDKKSLNIFLFNKKNLNEPEEVLTKFELEADKEILGEMISDDGEAVLFPVKSGGNSSTLLFFSVDQSKQNELRNTASKLIKSVRGKKFENIYLNVFPALKNPSVSTFRELLEGMMLGEYKFDKYKSSKDEEKPKKLNLVSSFDLENVISETTLLFNGVNLSRDLSNEPANVLTPETFASEVKNNLENEYTSVEVFDEKMLEEKNFGLILAVGNASANPPRLIKIHYKPENAIKKIVLVGKGVTYDSGGLSIKTTPGMFEMKADMAGAGSVAGAIYAASKNKLPYEIIGLLPAVENMLAGNSYKPGDVLTGYKGKTVEIGDTDAEGRLILADALEYANEFKPDYIIDLATLTGAAFISLGFLYSAMFTDNELLADTFDSAGKSTYELVWQQPLTKEYKSLLDTKMADIANLGPRHSGAITAALFLQHFVDEKIPWMHLDIAGPSIKNDILDYNKNYNTGYGVRLIYKALKSGKL
ncbi:MAG: putative cytosol aminopeptidase [Melioribacteraceae bacterium]|nr:MAG: putative cytosol aminopeptidase [Melioribacteraceae bacterium]